MNFIEYIPIITTLFSTYFLYNISIHFTKRKKLYLLWWALGVLTFGLGTLTESINVLFGWNEYNFKAWYIVGALLGGFPLAQGSVYLLMKKPFAHISSVFFITIITITSIFVLYSPIVLPTNFDSRLSGDVLGWQSIRKVSPIINTYAFLFLCGGAIYSALVYQKKPKMRKRFIGNIYIAIGALLPGIGGTCARYGYVEILFLTELLGLLLIYIGYIIIKKDKAIK